MTRRLGKVIPVWENKIRKTFNAAHTVLYYVRILEDRAGKPDVCAWARLPGPERHIRQIKRCFPCLYGGTSCPTSPPPTVILGIWSGHALPLEIFLVKNSGRYIFPLKLLIRHSVRAVAEKLPSRVHVTFGGLLQPPPKTVTAACVLVTFFGRKYPLI